jgi:hypothetical protein
LSSDLKNIQSLESKHNHHASNKSLHPTQPYYYRTCTRHYRRALSAWVVKYRFLRSLPSLGGFFYASFYRNQKSSHIGDKNMFNTTSPQTMKSNSSPWTDAFNPSAGQDAYQDKSAPMQDAQAEQAPTHDALA